LELATFFKNLKSTHSLQFSITKKHLVTLKKKPLEIELLKNYPHGPIEPKVQMEKKK